MEKFRMVSNFEHDSILKNKPPRKISIKIFLESNLLIEIFRSISINLSKTFQVSRHVRNRNPFPNVKRRKKKKKLFEIAHHRLTNLNNNDDRTTTIRGTNRTSLTHHMRSMMLMMHSMMMMMSLLLSVMLGMMLAAPVRWISVIKD